MDQETQDINFDTPCDLVGITGYTNHAVRMFEISSEFRKRGILAVGGGSFCTLHTEECRPHFDVLISGEAEHVWPKFLADWENGEHRNYYKGERNADLANSPVPRWDLVNLDNYASAIVQTSRGCPYDCEFCDVVALFGNRMRFKPVDHILNEIKIIERITTKGIFLADDNLIGNKKFVKELLKRLIEFNKTLKRPLCFCTQLTLNVAKDEELLDLFKQANFGMFFIGIETPNEESLVESNKKHNLLLDMKEAVRRIQSRGIYIISGLIVGFDSDGPDIFRMQSNFLIEAGLTIPMLTTLKAPKGTKLWARLKKEGRLLQEGNCDTFGEYTCNFIPKNMSREELEENFLALFKEIYSYSHFLKRFENLINQVDLKKVKTDSPLAWRMRSRRKWDYILATAYIIKYFIFEGDQKKRKFLFSLIIVALKKGIICFHLVYETLVFFISQFNFIQHLENRESKALKSFPVSYRLDLEALKGFLKTDPH